MIFTSIPSPPCLIGLLALALCSHSAPAGVERPGLDELWSFAERRLAAQVQVGVEGLKKTDDAASRELLLLEALAGLQAQPRTPASLREAQTILRELMQPVSAPDPVTDMAEFFLARSHEIALPAPDPAAARAAYLALAERRPSALTGQLALARVVLLDLATPQTRAERLDAYAKLDGWDDRFTHPLARRDYHLLMALTGLRYEADPHSIIRHVERACATGLLRSRIQADLLLGGAAMAARAGRPELAREWRQRFIDENPRDPRMVLVGKILSGEISL
ncbi:hypothetical protein OpiT1DRAFT_02867 [Opitutaceae bacterium TAV1]|nr:hypothetical protein OpiT1DRAFT_02867 [Opitutaceae bacterium TAV1]